MAWLPDRALPHMLQFIGTFQTEQLSPYTQCYCLCFTVHKFIPDLTAFSPHTVLLFMLYSSWVHSRLDSFHCVHSTSQSVLSVLEFISNLTAFIIITVPAICALQFMSSFQSQPLQQYIHSAAVCALQFMSSFQSQQLPQCIHSAAVCALQFMS